MNTAMPNAGPPAFYTVREAARILRVDPATVYRAIGKTPSPQCGSAPATSCQRPHCTSW